MSTSEDILHALESVSTSKENYEYIGGHHEYIGGLSSTSAGYHDTYGKQDDKAFQFILKTLMY